MGYVGKVTAGGSTHLVGSTLYGTCSTAANTAAKVVTCSDFTTLITGVTIHVKFTNANTVASPTLNVNSTGAKNIYRYGTTAPSTSAATSWQAGSVVSFTYDGSYWQMNGWLNDNTNTTYTFANGTNGFSVTPSGGSAQTVTVTPSITNNVTGTGSSGHIAKFDGEHTITSGPQFGGSGNLFLRNDATWGGVTGFQGYATLGTSASDLVDIHTWADSLDTGFWPFITSLYTRGTPDDSSTNFTMAHGYCLKRSSESSKNVIHIVLFSRDGNEWLDYRRTIGSDDYWYGWHMLPTDLYLDANYMPKMTVANNYTTTAAGSVLDARVGNDIFNRSLMAKGRVTSYSTNLNSILTPGVYQIGGADNATNLPSGQTYGTLVVMKGDTSASFFNQIFYTPADGIVAAYTRSTVDSGSTWRAWARFCDATAFENHVASLGGLKFEYTVKSTVGTGYAAANILSFNGSALAASNYNGHAFLIMLNGPHGGTYTTVGSSLYLAQYVSSATNTYCFTRLGGNYYSGAANTTYPRLQATAAGSTYVSWNALPGSSGLNIHASMFQLY